MKYIIDFIEDVREQIGNQEAYILTAGLLKPEEDKLVYAGEAFLNRVDVNDEKKELRFKIDGSDTKMTIGQLIPPLLISDMGTMMYELKIDINADHKDMEIVGFGKNEEQKRYILFIKI